MLRSLFLASASAAAASGLTWLALRSNVDRPVASVTARPTAAPLGIGPGRTGAEGTGHSSGGTAASTRTATARPLDSEGMGKAMGAVLTESDPVAALEQFTSLLRSLTPENAAAAWQAVEAARGPEAMRYASVLAHAWGAMDGPGALDALGKSRGRESSQARFHAMTGWASRDAAGAMAWLDNQSAEKPGDAEAAKAGKFRREDRDGIALLRMGLVNGMAATDPDGAARWIGSMDEKERGPLLAAVARRQMALGFDAASAWASRITDPALRADAVASVARRYADESPEQAAAWAAGEATRPEGREAVGAVAREWAARDPEKAIAWIQQLPAGPAQQEAWEDAFRSWSRTDPEASSRWLNTMPQGPSRDAAVSSLSRSVARTDPAAAIAWAGTIADPAARDAALLRTAQLWRTVDESAALQWATANLPPEQQQRLATEELPRPPKRTREDKPRRQR